MKHSHSKSRMKAIERISYPKIENSPIVDIADLIKNDTTNSSKEKLYGRKVFSHTAGKSVLAKSNRSKKRIKELTGKKKRFIKTDPRISVSQAILSDTSVGKKLPELNSAVNVYKIRFNLNGEKISLNIPKEVIAEAFTNQFPFLKK